MVVGVAVGVRVGVPFRSAARGNIALVAAILTVGSSATENTLKALYHVLELVLLQVKECLYASLPSAAVRQLRMYEVK